MFPQLAAWLKPLPARRPVRHPSRSRPRTPAAERLENRTLLTAYVVDTLAGTLAADGKISLSEAVLAARLNDTAFEAPAGSGAETDTITFHASLAGGTIVLD